VRSSLSPGTSTLTGTPSGRPTEYLYLSSNRGDYVCLLRVPIDEETGITRAEPELVSEHPGHSRGKGAEAIRRAR
jgi:hypothetical protein